MVYAALVQGSQNNIKVEFAGQGMLFECILGDTQRSKRKYASNKHVALDQLVDNCNFYIWSLLGLNFHSDLSTCRLVLIGGWLSENVWPAVAGCNSAAMCQVGSANP